MTDTETAEKLRELYFEMIGLAQQLERSGWDVKFYTHVAPNGCTCEGCTWGIAELSERGAFEITRTQRQTI